MADYPLKIMTPEGVVYDGRATSLQAPGEFGYFGILANHAPLVVSLGAGVITAKEGSTTSYFAVGAGVLEVSHEGVLVLADNAEAAASVEEGSKRGAELGLELAPEIN